MWCQNNPAEIVDSFDAINKSKKGRKTVRDGELL